MVQHKGWCQISENLLAAVAGHCSDSTGKTTENGNNHRITEWPGLKRTSKIIYFQPPWHKPGCQPLDQSAQSHIQPGLECLQGWGIHNLLGQPVPVRHHSLSEKLPLISNPNLPCLSVKSFPLVLSLPTLINSHCPSCLYAPFKYWKATMRSPWSLLFSKLNKPSSLKLSINSNYFFIKF